MDKHNMQCSDVDTNLFSSEDNNFGLGKPNYKTAKQIKATRACPPPLFAVPLFLLWFR